MKNLLIATDFSENAKCAANYGYTLAAYLKSNIVLLNAIIVPAEVPQAGMVVWPANEYNLLMEDSKTELSAWKKQLSHINTEPGFKPEIRCISEAGMVTDAVSAAVEQHDTELIVIGSHNNSVMGELLLGNHARRLVSVTTKPLLLISPGTAFQPVKKIAFATDFNNLKADLKTIYELIPVARRLNSELLIVHIAPQNSDLTSIEKSLTDILADLSNKANYPHIYYRVIKSNHIESGLDWLCENGQIDILAMKHRHSGFFDKLFNRSHTQKMARHIHIPLLVLPAGA